MNLSNCPVFEDFHLLSRPVFIISNIVMYTYHFYRLAARRFHEARAPSPHTPSNTFTRIADTVEKPSPSRMTDVAFSNLRLRVVPNPAFRCDWRGIGNVTSRGWLVRICIGFSKYERPGTCKISIRLYSHHDLPTILFAVCGIFCVAGSETFLTAPPQLACKPPK
jgi:hypothetical protein